MLKYISNNNTYVLFHNNNNYNLFCNIKRQWDIHPKLKPNSYVCMGQNQLVLSSTDKMAIDYLNLGTNVLLKN